VSAVSQRQAVAAAAGVPRRGAYDTQLALAALALLGVGLVMVASASVSIADREFQAPFHYFIRQLAFVSVGLLAAGIAMRLPLATWERTSVGLLLLGLLLLAAVLVPGVGREVNGSARWLRLGAVNVQASEPMKLFLVLYLAGYLVRRSAQVRGTIGGFLKPLLLLLLIAVLLLMEPDYGATVVLFATALGMLFLGGVSIVSFVTWLMLTALFLGGLLLASPYRLERLTAFLNPWADPFDTGFQLTQALIAIGRGGWLGVGLGESVQKLFYLPEAHTDFIFAVLAEELGFVGMTAVIGLFAFITWRAFAIARRAELAGLRFGAYLAYGIGLLVCLQAFINVGVNMGVLPTKGLTLPLISYGGSSVVISCLALGLLLRVDHEARVAR
jgi:cell division protein FtsW